MIFTGTSGDALFSCAIEAGELIPTIACASFFVALAMAKAQLCGLTLTLSFSNDIAEAAG